MLLHRLVKLCAIHEVCGTQQPSRLKLVRVDINCNNLGCASNFRSLNCGQTLHNTDVELGELMAGNTYDLTAAMTTYHSAQSKDGDG
jgi:hypothetical protein